MPTYRFTDPEGKIHRMTVPEGVSAEEAFEGLQRSGNISGLLESPVGRFVEGVTAPVTEFAMGIQGGPRSTSEELLLEVARRPGGAAKTAGEITGNIGLAAGPAATTYTGARALTRAVPWVRHWAPLAAESATVGGVEAAKIPQEGETRGGAATEAALWNMGIGTGMGALSRAAVPRMFPKSDAALREEAAQRAVGIEPRLPLAVAAEPTGPTGRVIQWLHRQPLRALPGAGAVLRGQTKNFVDDWRESMLLRALPERARGRVAMPRQRTGAEAPVEETFKGIDDWYKMEYREILDPFTFKLTRGPNAERLAQAYQGIPESGARREVTEKLGDYLQNLSDDAGNLSGSAVSSLKSRIRNAMRLSDDADVKAGWGDVIESLDEIVEGSLRQIDPDFATRYAELREPYRNLVTLETAGARTGAKYGELTPDDLYAASIGKGKKEQGARAVVQGRSPLKMEAQRASGLMEPIPKRQQESNIFQLGALGSMTAVGGWFAPWLTGTAWGGILGTLPMGSQRYLMGDLPSQSYMARMLRTPGARQSARAARIGVATQQEEE